MRIIAEVQRVIRRAIILMIAGMWFFASYGQKAPEVLKGDLIIFHAGSLSVPMKALVTEFKRLHPQVKILTESAGSVDCARKITDLNKPCDIMASADYTVIDKMLIPRYCNWNIGFVANEMCLVYTSRAKYANEINARNWYDILLRPDVIYGRSDPNSDPCGYRSVMTMQLAGKFYRKEGLASRLAGKDQNMIRPKEVDLVPLLETHAADYIFLYKSVAIQHGLKYLELPPEVNLRDPKYNDLYRTASVPINGKEPGQKIEMKGEAMVYGITMLKEAPNPQVAIRFLEFLLDPARGMKIMARNGHPSVIPQSNPHYDQIPASLQPFAKP